MSTTLKYTLADRPKWWLPRVMKWVSLLTAVLAFIMWIGSMILEALDVYALNPDANEEDSVALDLSYFADEIMWGLSRFYSMRRYSGWCRLPSIKLTNSFGLMRVTKTVTLFFKKEHEKMLRSSRREVGVYDAPLGEWV